MCKYFFLVYNSSSFRVFLNKHVFGPKGLHAGPAHMWKVNQLAKSFDMTTDNVVHICIHSGKFNVYYLFGRLKNVKFCLCLITTICYGSNSYMIIMFDKVTMLTMLSIGYTLCMHGSIYLDMVCLTLCSWFTISCISVYTWAVLLVFYANFP